MYPLARFSSMYAFSDSSSLGVRGYILQLIFCGASGLSLIGKSSSLSGGKHCASSSENTFWCCWYLSGIGVSFTGSKVATIVTFASVCHFRLKRYPPVRIATGSPFSSCAFQSISGFLRSNHRYPKIILSSPRLVTKNWKAVSLSPLLIHSWHTSVMVPSLFNDPSTLRTSLG